MPPASEESSDRDETLLDSDLPISLPPHLVLMIPTTANTSDLCRKINLILRTLNLPPAIDSDSLSQDIFIEAWLKRRPITHRFITHRAINSIRRLKGELTMTDTHVTNSPPIEAVYELQSTINDLLEKARLRHEQLSVIFHVFYKNRSFVQTAAILNWSEARVSDTYHSALKRLQAVARGGEE